MEIDADLVTDFRTEGDMAELNLSIGYFNHKKTRKLVADLGPGADVFPIRLWCYVAEQYPASGRLPGHTAEDIDAIVGFSSSELFTNRKIGDCTRAMLKNKFLDFSGGTYSIHNWKQRAGHIVAFQKRAKTAARARWDRVSGRATSNATSNAKSTTSNAASNALTNQPTEPTKPTNRTNQPNGEHGGNGEEGGAVRPVGGGLAGALRGAMTHVGTDRMLEVQAKLSRLEVNHEVVRELMNRNDITPALIDSEVEKIRSRRKPPDSFQGALVKALRDHQPGKIP